MIGAGRYRGSNAERLVVELKQLNFVETITIFGASLLLSVLPLLILMSSFASHRIEIDITRHIGLDRQGSLIVGELFRSSHQRTVFGVVTGVLVALAGSLSVAGSLQSIFERGLKVGHHGGRDILRFLVWVGALFGALAAESAIDAQLAGVAGRAVLNGLVSFIGTISFFWWSIHFLLDGRVDWRSCLPSALAITAMSMLLELFAGLYLSSSVVSDQRTYGTIGVVFTLMTWFIAIGAAIVVGTVLGGLWRDRRRGRESVRRATPTSG